jgi:tetratricopeptide (TPR) repeat protein
VACLLADALRGYFVGRGVMAQWLDVASTALSAATGAREAVAAHLSLGEAHWSRADYGRAVEHYSVAVGQARDVDWADAESSALGNLGSVYREMGDLREASRCFAEALEIDVRIGNKHKQVLDLMNLGVAHAVLGKLASAASLFEQAASLGREATSPAITGMVIQCLGLSRRYLGDLVAAERHLDAALAIFEEINDLSGQAGALESLSGVQADAGQQARALTTAGESLRLARRAGARRIEAAAHNALGAAEPDPATALAHHTDALTLAAEVGYGLARLDALIGQAGAHTRLGALASAEEAATRALTDARETDHRMQEGQALTALAEAALAGGDAGRAVELAAAALTVHEEIGYALGVTRARRVLADARR